MSGTKEKVLEATTRLMLRQGFHATSIDEICEKAGVTKGAFFHYFPSKDEATLSSLDYFLAETSCRYAAAADDEPDDPLARIHVRLAHVASMPGHQLEPRSCLIGTLTQEVWATKPEIREKCRGAFESAWKDLETDIDEARAKYAPEAKFSTTGVARYFTAVLQGSFILTKATGDDAVLKENVAHFQSYLDGLLGQRPQG